MTSKTAPISRFRVLPALLTPLVLGALACDTSTDPIPPSAVLFVLNANPAVNDLQMAVGAQSPQFDSPLAYGTTCCRDLYGNPRLLLRESEEPVTLSFTSGTSTNVIAQASVTPTRDSLFFYALIQDPVDNAQSGLIVLRNDTDLPAEGTAKLRFINAAPPAEGFDVYITAQDADDITSETPAIANLTYAQVRTHIQFTPPDGDSVRIRVTATGTKAPVLLDKSYFTGDLNQVTDGLYFGEGSTNTVFLINDKNTRVRPFFPFVVGGL